MFLISSVRWDKVNDNNEMLLNEAFVTEEKELKYYTNLAQKQLDKYIQKT